MPNTLIIGATSAIAQAVARRFAADGDSLFLIARNQDKLHAVAEDMRVRGARTVDTAVMDALDYAQHLAVIQRAVEHLGRIDVALIAYGTLPDQKACEASFEHTQREFETNAFRFIPIYEFMI